jgi:carboxyl-terminal processing protease
MNMEKQRSKKKTKTAATASASKQRRAELKTTYKALWQRKAVRVGTLGVVVILIFELGINIGSGRIHFWGLSDENKNLPSQLDYSSVNQVYDLIKDNYDGKLTTNQLLDGLKEGLAQATGDPYTEYFNATEAKQLNDELQGTFSGIGAQLGEDSSNNLEIIAPVAGTPAAKAGLQPHDIITAINGKETNGMSVDTAVDDIRGPQGTKVTLSLVRNSQPLTVTITRENITVPSVTSKILSGNIGYMQISQFTDDTGSLALQAAQQFKKAGVTGVVLDLRDNPGGEVNAAVSVSSLWLKSNTLIMQEKHDSTVLQTYTATGNDTLYGIPSVVLINAGSASASEITAGALHDNGAARLIGVTSYGKGVVQELDNISGGSELKVTIAHWYRPDGKNINHIGITPDQTVQLTAAQAKVGQDPQLAAAVSWLQQHNQ